MGMGIGMECVSKKEGAKAKADQGRRGGRGGGLVAR